MFKRPLRVKSQTVVKRSERKSFLEQLRTCLPDVSLDTLRKDLFPDGDDIIVLKTEFVISDEKSILSKNSEEVHPTAFLIYCNTQKQPLVFSFDVPSTNSSPKKFQAVYLPTLYTIWRFPEIVPLSFLTFPEVIPKLQNGADFMLAGANIPEATLDHLNAEASDNSNVNGLVCEIDSGAAVALGQMLMTRKELREKLQLGGELKGRLLKIVHVIGDHLWGLGDKSGPPKPEHTTLNSTKSSEATADQVEADAGVTHISDFGIEDLHLNERKLDETMDDLLKRVFLVTLKSKATSGNLPMLASTLNMHMHNLCRRICDKPLDIKQSSFKKLSKFLEEMQAQNIVSISTKKGVVSVDDVTWRNLEFTGVTALLDQPGESKINTSIRIPSSIRQVYVVNGKTAPIFQNVNSEIGKGYEFRTTEDVRELVSQYIKGRNLVSLTDKSTVLLDRPLTDLLMNKGVKFQENWPMKWSELFDKYEELFFCLWNKDEAKF